MQLDAFAKKVSMEYGQELMPSFTSHLSGLATELGKEVASSVLVTSTWQTLLESPDLAKRIYPRALKGASQNLSPGLHLEKYIICAGNDQYFLLIFDPQLTTTEPVILDASEGNSTASVGSGHSIWRTKMNTSFSLPTKKKAGGLMDVFDKFRGPQKTLFQKQNDAILESILPETVRESVEAVKWPIVVVKPPERKYTSWRAGAGHKLSLDLNEKPKAMAGVYAFNSAGAFGCTTCLHAFPNSYVEIGKTRAFVDGVEGVVRSAHNISDSCFIELPKDSVRGLTKLNGYIEKSTPRQFEPCSFVNRDGETLKTTVTGWSLDILYYDPYNQVKVLTKAVTNPGDSGSALVDETNKLLGFSFFRTEVDAPLEFSAWIWGASVFKAHGLVHQ